MHSNNRYIRFLKKKTLTFLNLLIKTTYRILSIPQKVINKLSNLIIKSFPRKLAYAFEWLINKKTPVKRRYIRKGFSVEDFFDELNKRNVKYVILRWFDELPAVKQGEDIDLLIADEDLSRVGDLFTYLPYTQACDIYSVTGLDGTGYKNMPYYPPVLANELLNHRVLMKRRFYVPDQKRHFLSLAYHAVFHKGSFSGLTNRYFDKKALSDHDYKKALFNIEQSVFSVKEDFDYVDLFNVLKQSGWVPEIDTFRILAKFDPWIKNLVDTQDYKVPRTDGDLIVFIIREWAEKNDCIEVIQRLLKVNYRLDILYSKKLTDAEKSAAKSYVRGGVWHRGPYSSHGGDPSHILVCFDYKPKWGVDKRYPYVANLNILSKHEIRDRINREVLYPKTANFIHSSDDLIEAINYIQRVIPNSLDQIIKDIEDRQYFFAKNFNVIETFNSNGIRSKTEKIRYKQRDCIKKTFKLGYERHLSREVKATKELKNHIDVIPAYISSGENYVITEFYKNVLDDMTPNEARQCIRRKAQDIVNAMKMFYEHGYAIIGFYPGNLIITPDDKLIIIDYEFLHKYDVKPKSFLDSYDIVGVPDGFAYDKPIGRNHTYKKTWAPILGPIEKYL
jgi:hypothetical protein